MVTHDPAIAAEADRIVRLVEGRSKTLSAAAAIRSSRINFRNRAIACPSKSTSPASSTTRKTPRSASTITACSTATACSRGFAVYGGKVFRLEQHLERLWNSAKAIWLEIPMTPRGDGPGHRRHARRQQSPRRLHPPGRHPRRRQPGPRPDADQRSAGDHHHRPHCALSGRALRNGLEIVTASTVRNHPAALSPRIKSLNYLNNILAKIEGYKPAASKP